MSCLYFGTFGMNHNWGLLVQAEAERARRIWRSRMLSRWWSWQLVLPVAALVTLFSVMHFFFAPLMPSFIHDSSNAPKLARIGGNSYSSTTLACEVGGGSASSPPVFRNATWRAEIGSWLSRCDQSANPVPVAEVSNLATIAWSLWNFPALFLSCFWRQFCVWHKCLWNAPDCFQMSSL